LKSKQRGTASRERLQLPNAWVRRVRSRLLAHFDRHRRPLPWRANADPYRVWVSEIMLQQTRVDTVRPYYDRWLQRFPTVHALADATVDDVLKAWEGLGYYHRARNLHAAARVVCERHSGLLPDTAVDLRALPGIGDYTAGAIASIAYSRREPVIDGNVNRVIHRLLDAARIPARELRAVAAALVPAKRPGDFNQALMEHGATICTPRAPRCPDCPLRAECRAFANGTQLERPAAQAKREIPDRSFDVVVLIDEKQNTLLRQRPERGLLAGLWEFPTRDAVQIEEALELVGTVVHTFSHFRASYRVLLGRVASVSPSPLCQIVHWTDLNTFAMPKAQRRIAALIESRLQQALVGSDRYSLR
jgi:A/G-specific adenine glycosylase